MLSLVNEPKADPITARTIDTVARTAYGEARGEGEIGMQAVINTMQNRVALQTWFGKNLLAVCTKPFQFSCRNPSDANFAKIAAVDTDDPQFVIALKLAKMAVAGELEDITQASTHYFEVGSPKPTWVKGATFTVQIGHHLFYRDVR